MMWLSCNGMDLPFLGPAVFANSSSSCHGWKCLFSHVFCSFSCYLSVSITIYQQICTRNDHDFQVLHFNLRRVFAVIWQICISMSKTPPHHIHFHRKCTWTLTSYTPPQIYIYKILSKEYAWTYQITLSKYQILERSADVSPYQSHLISPAKDVTLATNGAIMCYTQTVQMTWKCRERCINHLLSPFPMYQSSFRTRGSSHKVSAKPVRRWGPWGGERSQLSSGTRVNTHC